MAGMWMTRGVLRASTGEIVGRKAGLVLTVERVQALLDDDDRTYWDGDPAETIRMRSEVFEQLIATILHRVGNIRSNSIAPPGIVAFRKYRSDPDMASLFPFVMEMFTTFLQLAVAQAATSGNRDIDPEPFVDAVAAQHGSRGRTIALELLQGMVNYQHRSPWSDFRRLDWVDIKDLEELFNSENLQTYYGTFFDQRFIDYLDSNFDDISNIHWRQFEGLTCEFFVREGFHVEIGQGRNDEGVDARVWPTRPSPGMPPSIIIQCKRQQDKVEKVVVKALWADVVSSGDPYGFGTRR